MKALPAKVHFVCPQHLLWPELHDGQHAVIAPEIIAQRSISGLDCWIIRTFYELRAVVENVSIGPASRPDAINICEPITFGRKNRMTLDFLVSAVHDQYPSGLANCHIVQNASYKAAGRPMASVPHWPQPGIIPRDKSRETKVERVSFKGYWINLDEGFRSQSFTDQLSSMGIVLDLGPTDDTSNGMNWTDYSVSDAVIAVRNLTVYDATNKPASKLVNAWWGEVVALLGPEMAFRELRQSPLDYFEVRGPQDAVDALRKLQEQPELYRSMIAQGLQRRAEFTVDKVRAAWIAALEGVLFDHFAAWQGKGALEKLATVVQMHIGEPKVRALHIDRILNGPRILDQGQKTELVGSAH